MGESALLLAMVICDVNSPLGSPSGIMPLGEPEASERMFPGVAAPLPCALERVMERVVGRVGVGTGSRDGCELMSTRVVSLIVLGETSPCWLAGNCCSPSGCKEKGMRTAMVGCTNLTSRSTEMAFLPGQ